MGNEKDHGVLLDGSGKIVLGGLIAEFSGYTASSVCATSCGVAIYSTCDQCYPHPSHYPSFESVSSAERLGLTLA